MKGPSFSGPELAYVGCMVQKLFEMGKIAKIPLGLVFREEERKTSRRI